MPSLAAGLDQHPGIWRGGELARTACPGIATGFAALDAELPGGGGPRAARTPIPPQRAAGDGRPLAVLVRPSQAAREPSPAVLRIALATSAGGLALSILKRRGT